MSHFDSYYARQAFGGGFGPTFSGASLQRGHGGLGNILNSAFRFMVPIMKQAGKTVAKQGLNTGLSILGDVMSGSNIKKATKRRLIEGGNQLVKKAKTQLFSHTQPTPQVRRKTVNKRPPKRKNAQFIRKQRKSKHRKDIFD